MRKGQKKQKTKKMRLRNFQGPAGERAASVRSPYAAASPASLFITDVDHPSLRRDGCTPLSLTVTK